MPRRIMSILGAMLAIDLDRYPASVLDIGSGSGATALAIDLINAPRHVNLLGIEPSGEMIAFAETSRFTSRVTARYQVGSLGDGTFNRALIDTADLVVLSASFPYHFGEWEPLLAALGNYENNAGKMILAVEPEAKADILRSFGRRLGARGWPTETFCCHDLPEIIKRDDIALKDMQEVWKRIGSPGSVPPRTWWNPPDDSSSSPTPSPLGRGLVRAGCCLAVGIHVQAWRVRPVRRLGSCDREA